MNYTDISIDVQNKKFTLNEDMYGVFFEEINHSGDGGLYGELIRNRNFLDATIPEGSVYFNNRIKTAQGHSEEFSIKDPLDGWSLLTSGNSIAKIEPYILEPRNEKVANQLKLIAHNVVDGNVKVINKGYFGMAIDKEEYELNIIIRGIGVSSVDANIVTSDMKSIASTSVNGVTAEFQKFTLRFKASEKANKCMLAISPTSDGELYLDFVSLFPVNTYKNRKNGMNRRLAKMIEDLKPKFFRFPGGCIVEGISLDNAFMFKDTIGPVEDRAGKWNLWGYRRTDGIGFHEYLQFCEDTGANAMYVLNCGMSCQGRSPQFADKDGIDEFLQDAVDAIDYATADTTNKWGKLRTENGHPEPFNLKYVEIGNENYGEKYIERYKYFHKELKSRYPNIIFIINDTKYNEGEVEFDIFDEHFYTTPELLPAMAKRYDKYDRDSYKVYVGEYAANQDVGIGNMAAAVSEASFMINMERNGDVVTMASYAPLLCHMQDRKWPVNLICFEDDIVFGIPSYHVQKLFNDYIAETILDTEVNTKSFANEAKVHAIAGIDKDGNIVLKISNFSCYETKINIKGIEDYSIVNAFEIASSSPEDSNSIENPEYIKARKIDIDNQHILKPYGVYTVIYK